ncbi:MAG: aminopeptidase [Eubacteriales bacterium]|nr:aminopeptidase [Eubacteriales bacterium]
MFDPRILKLADGLVNFSCAVKPGENVLIQSIGGNEDLTRALIKTVYKAGGVPFLWLEDKSMDREIMLHCTPEQLTTRANVDAAMMSQMQAFIGIRGGTNANEFSDVPGDKFNDYMTYYWTPVHGKIRVPKTKWVILRYPSPSMAQLADMSTEAFEDYFFSVCTLDYSKMDKAMDSLKALMERTDKVRLVAPGTDLTFSIKGLPAIKCAGNMNIPDGEIYTAPVKYSINGTIAYNTPSLEAGFTFTDIKFTFKDGKIIEATSNDNARINKQLDIDEGARYVGEFAIGVNPYITFPMKDTLFDEKIAGSIHFTPGSCYDDCNNGNKSSQHWDIVLIQTPEYGGGEIWFDDVLIRKDGMFVLPELLCLNPENLK